MDIFLLAVSILCWAGALVSLFWRQLLSPALSYLGLLTLSFATKDGYPLVPINNTILIGWLCMTLVVMLATVMQSPAVVAQRRGMGYMLGGALVGLAVGLLGFTFTTSAATLYAVMIIGVVAGLFFGYILFTNTPAGKGVSFRSGNFYTYLLAKGFPTAITVMQIGVVLVILEAMKLA